MSDDAIFQEERRLDQFYAVLFPLMFTIMGAGVLVFGFQVFFWLKMGEWPPISLADAFAFAGWEIPQTSWRGLQQLLNWLPLSMTLLAGPLILFPLFEAIGKDTRKQASFARSRKVKAEREARKLAEEASYDEAEAAS